MMGEVLFILRPLVLTILLEGTAGYLLGLKSRREQTVLMLMNGITNPLLVLTGSLLMNLYGVRTGMILVYAVLEPLVIFVEGILLGKALDHPQPFLLSLELNLVSILGGILCSKLL